VPSAAFSMPLDQAGIKEHVYNILTEAGFETVGDLMVVLKSEPDKVLGLPGVGPKAIQNIEEAFAALTFPEPVVVAETPAEVAAVAVEEMPVVEKQAEVRKEPKKPAEKEEEDTEHAKDGVSLDDLFQMKPEIFQAIAETEEESDDKKKGKKKKKTSVELVLDESLGAVVGRKKHKRGDDGFDEEE
jgi:N utilization substance protein A